jgi:hypothetical protein
MMRIVLWIHAASVLVGYSLVLCVPARYWPSLLGSDRLGFHLASVLFHLAALGTVTGLGLMAARPPQSESVLLAISTVAAFALFFL